MAHRATSTASPRLTALEDKVLGYLAQIGLTVGRSQDDLYLFKYGSTVVMVNLFEDEENTYVRIASTLLTDFELSVELMVRLLQLNTEVRFGAFLLFDDRTLSFATTLLGDHLDFDELIVSLRYVAKVSDDYDDVLQALAHGKKAQDILDEAAQDSETSTLNA